MLIDLKINILLPVTTWFSLPMNYGYIFILITPDIAPGLEWIISVKWYKTTTMKSSLDMFPSFIYFCCIYLYGHLRCHFEGQTMAVFWDTRFLEWTLHFFFFFLNLFNVLASLNFILANKCWRKTHFFLSSESDKVIVWL